MHKMIILSTLTCTLWDHYESSNRLLDVLAVMSSTHACNSSRSMMMLCEISYIVIMTIWREKRMQRTHTEAFIDEVVECVTITCVCKLIVIGRQLLKTLDCNSTEVSRKCCVLRQHCCAPRYKAVDERLSPHVDPASSMSLNHSKLITSRVLNPLS